MKVLGTKNKQLGTTCPIHYSSCALVYMCMCMRVCLLESRNFAELYSSFLPKGRINSSGLHDSCHDILIVSLFFISYSKKGLTVGTRELDRCAGQWNYFQNYQQGTTLLLTHNMYWSNVIQCKKYTECFLCKQVWL